MSGRIFNFSSGPAVMPLPVLEKAQQELLSLKGIGMSVMEISHRSATFQRILDDAEAGVRQLLSVPQNYRILFLQGGASLQFSMVPLNFLGRDQSADYIVTGQWGKKALPEARRCGNVNVTYLSETDGFSTVPTQDEVRISEN